MSLPLPPAAPWYRHRWPWLLMLGPFVVIVAAGVTLWLAIRSDDGLVADDYYKQGLAINQETSRVRRAAALGLHSELSIDAERRIMRVALRGGNLKTIPQTLILNLAHPTRSGFDQSIRLQREDKPGSEINTPPIFYSAGWTGELSGRWLVTLEDESREWRLAGNWDVSTQPVFVLPVPQ